MPSPVRFIGEALTIEELSSLQELAHALWDARGAVAAEWAQRLIELLPEYFPASGVSVEQLAQLNESFLSLVLKQIQEGDMAALYQDYYRRTRELIEADLRRAPAHRISLNALYTSARVSLRVIGAHAAAADPRLMLAYAKLTAQLMMLVGQAYSDAREVYLQRAFEQINTLSHELRAPLSHLFGYLELLQEGDFGPVSPQQEQVLSELIHETDDLLWLLAGTLDLSRLDTGKVELRVEEFPLETVLTEVVNATPRPDGALTWSVPSDLPRLRTDRVKVKQIIGNLVRNAVRYGGSGPVEVAACVPQPGVVEVSVRDRGPGIKPEDLQVIFNFFERGGGGRLARDGYGIGLHVVRRLVRLLNGTIAVDSAPGQGSCFRFTIPLRHSTQN